MAVILAFLLVDESYRTADTFRNQITVSFIIRKGSYQ